MNAIQSCLKQDLQNISEWLIAKKTHTKYDFMLIGPRQKLSTLTDTTTFITNGTPHKPSSNHYIPGDTYGLKSYLRRPDR